MAGLDAFLGAVGGAVLPTALIFLFVRSQVTVVKTEVDGVKEDLAKTKVTVKATVASKDCGGQPCGEVEEIREVLQGKLGDTGIVSQVENIEKLVSEIREHQKNGGSDD